MDGDHVNYQNRKKTDDHNQVVQNIHNWRNTLRQLTSWQFSVPQPEVSMAVNVFRIRLHIMQ